MIASLTGAAVGGTPADAQTGGAVGQNAVENNTVNQKQTGTINTFIDVFNNTPSKMGQTKVQAAHNAMLRLSNTDWDYTPNVTPYFNLSKSRYIYTSKAGWIDIVHFLFYASIAYREKIELIKKNDVDWKLPFNYGQIRRLSLE
ncbi:VENN motif pre-toxin domain-containing protein, partial [Neisseria bergeri]|uniref:VENN motif pre-toxin domain-containing protein n=1 Tax=Neisseria bergeri TaxID=1906581 RepID=UPI00272A401E